VKQKRVMLSRTCPDHGEMTNCISSDSRFYWLSKGNPANGEACCAEDGEPCGVLGSNAFADRDPTFQSLSTCLALIEIVDSCNLSCPTCYADSQPGTGAALNYVPMEELQRRIQGAIDRKGGIEILQFSGGEPTLHPHFFELLEWTMRHPDIDYALINTNGLRLAAEPEFAQRLKACFDYGKTQIYLQFDGVQEAGQQSLRGLDLRKTREKALQNAQEIGLPVTLAMTVIPENREHLWEAVEFGLRFEHVRGITFQPMFYSGRSHASEADLERLMAEHLNTADIIIGLVEQSGGKLCYDDFTPLPCGDPNCATIGYLLKVMGQVRSISDFVNFKDVQGFLRDRLRYDINDLKQCGCDSEPLGELLHRFEIDEKQTFRLFVKPFMDAFTWDDDRLDRCCTHVIRPDGKLDSFCRYYADPVSSTVSTHEPASTAS